MAKPKDLGHLAHIVAYDAGNHITLPAGITMHTNQLVASQAWVTTALGSYALSSSLGSYVPTSRKITINGTEYDLSADRSWNITSMIYPAAGIALSTGTAWGSSITNNSANWNTAYGWGNHASAGYLTSINSSQVTTALGFTPVTNARTITINGTAYDLSADRSWTVSASSASYLTGGDSNAYMLLYNSLGGNLNDYNSPGLYSAEYVGSANKPSGFSNGHFIQISDAGGTDVKTQWYYNDAGDKIAMRLMWGNGTWRSWRSLIHDGNIGSQSVNYASSAGNSSSTSQREFDYLRVNSNNDLYLDYNYGCSIVGIYASTRYQGVYSMGNAYKLARDGTSTGNLYGLAWSHPNAGGVAGNLNDHGLLVLINGGFAASVSSSIRAASDMRAPIFYDQNDTGYYLDLNSTSNSAMRIRGGALFGPNTTWGAYLRIGSNGNTDYAHASVAATNGNLHMDGASGCHMYLNYYVNGNIYLNGSTYYINSNGSYYNGTSSYANNSGALNGWGYGSYAYRSSGTGYYQIDTWMQMNGSHGIYWPSYYGAHIYPNTATSYTQIRFDGDKNGYSGAYLAHSGVNGMMYDGAGNGGVYREANGRWFWYYHLGNACMSINGATTSSSYAAYINGSLYATGDIVAYSDKRKKENIITVDDALEKVLKLRGVYYNKIDDDKKKRLVGVIAQETEQVVPEVVTYSSDIDEYGVSYGNLSGLFIEAFKKQQERIDKQDEQIEELKNIINGLTK